MPEMVVLTARRREPWTCFARFESLGANDPRAAEHCHQMCRVGAGWTAVPADGQLWGAAAPCATTAAVLMQACCCLPTAHTCHLRGWRRILSPRKQESLMQARGVKLQRVGMGGSYVDRKCKLATAILAQRNKNCMSATLHGARRQPYIRAQIRSEITARYGRDQGGKTSGLHWKGLIKRDLISLITWKVIEASQ